jgi:DNA-binding SARP family transcriptional activator
VTVCDYGGGPSVLAGCWAAPLSDPAARVGLPLSGLSSSAPLVINLLPGEVHLERLASDLARAGRAPRWIRLAPYDLDRPTLDDLAAAIGNKAGGSAQTERPVVVESDDRQQAERFLSRLALAEPPGLAQCVVLHYVEVGKERRRAAQVGRVTHPAGMRHEALEHLTGSRLALYDSVLDAGRRLRPGDLATIIEQSRDVDELTAHLAGRLLQDIPLRTKMLLGFAALLGYCHPRFASLEPVLDSSGNFPWWTELTGEWRRFEPVWRGGVLAVCRSDSRPQLPLLGRLVGELAEDGAASAAIELCLDAGSPGAASDLIAGVGPDLLSAGRALSVRRWLVRLPRISRRRHRALAAQARAAGAAARRTERKARRKEPGGTSRPPRPAGTLSAARPGRPSGVSGPAQGPHLASISPLVLQAHLLGPVDISIGGHRVEQWHGRKGALLLAYLLLHRADRPVPRDAIAATFWPDAPPEASRNRLHVTLHALRADLQSAFPIPVVLFNHGYKLNPELDVRVDTEEFERAAARAKQAENDGDIEAALGAYRHAAREYHGDLLSDHPYDDWTLLPREHYRVKMLDVLGRAAQLAFDDGRYPESVETGQRLLALDFCREDLHRLLMRAHSRLGRPHLAMHQFEICSRQLRRELDMAPAEETIDLYDRIRARLPV